MKCLVAILVVTFLAVSLVQSYDFSDPAFNALLAEEYNEFMVSDDQQESLLNYRTKREAPCGAGHKKELPSQRCCKEAIERPEAFDKVRDLKKECFGQVKGNRTELDFEHEMFSCERIQKKKEDMRCAYECIAKKQKMFGDNNEMDETATVEYFRREFVDLPWVKDNLESIVSTCIGEGVAKKDEEAADEKCSGKPMKFLFCTWREFTKKCPAEQQKDSKSCKLIREGKVEFIHHSHGHHHSHE